MCERECVFVQGCLKGGFIEIYKAFIVEQKKLVTGIFQ
jgi:hypothetical protein